MSSQNKPVTSKEFEEGMQFVASSFDRVTEMIRKNAQAIDKNAKSVSRLDQKMDEHTEEIIRHFDAAAEDIEHKTDAKLGGHEHRIQTLEKHVGIKPA